MENDIKLKTPEGKIYKPNNKQKEFHQAMKRERLFCGGVGSGKTLTGCVEGLKLSLKYPNNIGLISRETYGELEDTTKRTFLEICPDSIIKEYRVKRNKIILTNGSEILFRSLDKAFKLRSLKLGWAYIDEITEIQFEFYRELNKRLRLKNVPFRSIFGTTNSDNPSHWVHQYFYQYKEATISGDIVELNKERIEKIKVVNASTLENKENLPDDYIEYLLNTDEESVERFVEGRWLSFSGLVFPFDESKDVVTFDTIPECLKYLFNKDRFAMDTEEILIGADKGWSNATAFVFIAKVKVNGSIVYFQFDEIYGSKLSNDEILARVLTKLKEYSIFNYRVYADPSALEMIDALKQGGLLVYKANNAVKDGIDFVRELINRNQYIILKDNCPHTLSERQLYKFSVANGIITDAPVKLNDHTQDALRYALYSDKKNVIQIF